MLEALRIRDFRLLWSARLTSLLGSWLLVVAAPAYVFKVSGSLVAVGLTIAAEYLPILVLGPIAGAIADRWNRRQIMVSMDLMRVGAVALFFLVHSADTVWIMYAAMTLESVGSVLFRPASQALIPLVVGSGKALSGAASLNSLTDAIVRLAGAPLGAALMVATGFYLLVGLDMASYVGSAALISMTRGHYPWLDKGKLTARRAGAELADGVRAIRRSRMARGLLPVSVLFLTANASLSAVLIPFGITHWGGQRQVGLIISALGVGFLVGAPMVRALSDRVQPRLILACALIVTVAGFFVLFHSGGLLSAMASAALVGLCGPPILATPQITLQRVILNEVLGRVSAAFYSGEALATLVGSLVGPSIAQSAGYAWTAGIACVGVAITAVLSLLVVPAMVMSADQAKTKPSANVAGGSDPAVISPQS